MRTRGSSDDRGNTGFFGGQSASSQHSGLVARPLPARLHVSVSLPLLISSWQSPDSHPAPDTSQPLETRPPQWREPLPVVHACSTLGHIASTRSALLIRWLSSSQSQSFFFLDFLVSRSDVAFVCLLVCFFKPECVYVYSVLVQFFLWCVLLCFFLKWLYACSLVLS